MRASGPDELVAPALLGLAARATGAAPAAAQADFYKGKTVELIISTGAGGGLDTNGRIVARHLGNHIPGNPTIVAKNMPGAGHIRAANYVFNQAPKDGTTIGTFIPIFVMAQVLERSKSIQFNPANFQWLVSTSSSNSTVYVWHTTGVKTLEDAMQRQVLMGGTGVGSYNVIYPTVHQQRGRHQVQARHGLSQHHRDRDRDGARRGAGPRRQQFQQPDLRTRRVAQDRQDQPLGAGRTRARSAISRPCR